MAVAAGDISPHAELRCRLLPVWAALRGGLFFFWFVCLLVERGRGPPHGSAGTLPHREREVRSQIVYRDPPCKIVPGVLCFS